MELEGLKVGDQVVVDMPIDSPVFCTLEDWVNECGSLFIARIEGFNKEKDQAFLSMVYIDHITGLEISSGVEYLCDMRKATKAEIAGYSTLLYKYDDQFKA